MRTSGRQQTLHRRFLTSSIRVHRVAPRSEQVMRRNYRSNSGAGGACCDSSCARRPARGLASQDNPRKACHRVTTEPTGISSSRAVAISQRAFGTHVASQARYPKSSTPADRCLRSASDNGALATEIRKRVGRPHMADGVRLSDTKIFRSYHGCS